MAKSRPLGDPSYTSEPSGSGTARAADPSAATGNGAVSAGQQQAGRVDPHLTAASGQHLGFSSVLRNRYFLRLWMAQLISQTVMNAANYGVIILLNEQTHGSAFATSGAVVAFSLPAIILGAPAGVLVDRLDRRRVLWVSNLLRALASLVFVGSLLVNPGGVLPVFILTFFIAAVGQFFSPAEGAAIPLLVRQEELVNALALFNITFTLAQAAGLIVLGPLVLLFLPKIVIGLPPHSLTIDPVASLFLIVAVLYVVCAVLILTIPVRRLRIARVPQAPSSRVQRGQVLRQEERQIMGIWSGVLECGRFIRHDRRLAISVVQLTIGGMVVAVIGVLAPRFVTDFFHQPAKLAALVFVPAGAGLVLGSILTPRLLRHFHYLATVTIGFIGLAAAAGLITVVRVLAPVFHPQLWWESPVYLAIMILLTFLMGMTLDFINIPAQTLLQERSPDWVKGRVLAVQTLLLNAATVIFVPAMGIAVDALGLPVALVILAAFVASAGLISVYYLVRGQHARQL